MSKKKFNITRHIIVSIVGFIMIYPIIWLFFSTFKSNYEIFTSIRILPIEWSFEGYKHAFKGLGNVPLWIFYKNSFLLVIPTVIATVISSTIVAYGFSRFNFNGKKILQFLLISTVMLPSSILIIPRFLLFNTFKMVDTYWPFIAPELFAQGAFFVFLLIQFMKGIPKEIDEAAYIDGCNSFHILWRIIFPMSRNAVFSVIVFQSMWIWNDFQRSLIFINSLPKYTVPLALRASIDSTSIVEWSKVLAMSLMSIIPIVLLFFFAQKYFVKGITAGSLKG